MPARFRGQINVDIRDSQPDWTPFEPSRAPDRAPNVLYIVLDDVGFSAMSCYGGPIETPILSEQWKEYVALQLKMYASGDRRNDVYGRMREIASRLTPAEINGLATYYRAGFR